MWLPGRCDTNSLAPGSIHIASVASRNDGTRCGLFQFQTGGPNGESGDGRRHRDEQHWRHDHWRHRHCHAHEWERATTCHDQ